ncbi:MAG: hypothetical protein ACOC1K_03560 [Nanoarchaeota archaeon]
MIIEGFDKEPFLDILEEAKKATMHIERGKEDYFNVLVTQLRLKQTLQAHIDDEVYSVDPQNIYGGNDSSLNNDSRSWYERTGTLRGSVSLKREMDEIFLFTDKNILENSPQANTKSIETGYGEEAHSKLKNYAWTVEKGHTYKNRTDSGAMKEKDWYMPPRPFMEKTFNEILSKTSTGKYHPNHILDRLTKGWEN